MQCKRCGKEIPEDSRYCPTCGEPVVEGAATTEGKVDAADAAAGAAGKVAHSAMNAAVQGVQAAADRLNEVAGGTGHVELRFGDFFDEVFKKHEKGDAEELFVCGTRSTTPAPEDISREWPHPWLYSRVFLVLFAALVGLWAVTAVLEDYTGVVGFTLVASLLVNISVVVFFFETNAPRNVSFPFTLAVFLLGGILATLVAAPFTGPTGAGSVVGALVGEAAKIAVLAVALPRLGRGDWVLTGMLVGAAVGAGYSVFSSVGVYVGTAGATIASHVLSALGYHAALGAVEGGALALARVKRGALAPFLGLCLVFAALWNVDVPLLSEVSLLDVTIGTGPSWLSGALTLQGVVLTVAAWVVIIVLLHRGLAQINDVSDGLPDSSEEDAVE